MVWCATNETGAENELTLFKPKMAASNVESHSVSYNLRIRPLKVEQEGLGSKLDSLCPILLGATSAGTSIWQWWCLLAVANGTTGRSGEVRVATEQGRPANTSYVDEKDGKRRGRMERGRTGRG